MGRKPCVDRTLKEKQQIVQEGAESGNVSGTCRRQARILLLRRSAIRLNKH